jgi:hypothetical protein
VQIKGQYLSRSLKGMVEKMTRKPITIPSMRQHTHINIRVIFSTDGTRSEGKDKGGIDTSLAPYYWIPQQENDL